MTLPPEILAEIVAELEALRDGLRRDALAQVREIAARWAAIREDPAAVPGAAGPEIRALADEAHRLAGSAGTFALCALATAARGLEAYLEGILDEPAGTADPRLADRLVAELVAASA